MVKHTPGPWRVEGQPGYASPEIWGPNRPIARVMYHEGSEDREVDPNARLIAAAPDLLAACEAFVMAMDNSPAPWEEETAGVEEAYNMARAAFTAARPTPAS